MIRRKSRSARKEDPSEKKIRPNVDAKHMAEAVFTSTNTLSNVVETANVDAKHMIKAVFASTNTLSNVDETANVDANPVMKARFTSTFF